MISLRWNILSSALIASIMLMVVGCAGNRKDTAMAQPAASSTAGVDANENEKDLAVRQLRGKAGIEVESIRLSSAGYMLDFRYRVVNASLAVPVMDRTAVCYVIDQKSGAKMIVPAPPKVGSLRQKSTAPVEGKIYYMMFANPGRRIQAGDKVTVVIDTLEIPDLTVQ